MCYVYLFHFHRPISPDHTAQHYMGYAEDLALRMQRQRAGNGARFVQVARERGIGFTLVRVWRGGRRLERRLKNQKNAPRLCPICNPDPAPHPADVPADEIDELLIPF